MEVIEDARPTRANRRHGGAAAAAATLPVRPPMHRKGSLRGHISEPATLKERLAARRMEQNMSQLEVARKINFWNNKQQKWTTLSRSAYCMYESGEVVPDLDKIERLAKVLHCSPEWLAFGIGNRNAVEEVDYDPKKVEFVAKSFWNLDEDWVRTRFESEPNEVVLCVVNDFSPNLKPGDVAVVRKDIEPSAAGGEFVFAHNDELTVAHVTRPNATTYRVYEADLRRHEEVGAGDLHFLGKVIGKLGDL